MRPKYFANKMYESLANNTLSLFGETLGGESKWAGGKPLELHNAFISVHMC